MEAAVRALADGSRRTMLERLSRGPVTVGELAALLPIARPGVSRHLRVLREAGLGEGPQDAQRRGFNPPPPPPPRNAEKAGPAPGPWGNPRGAPPPQETRGKPDPKRHQRTTTARPGPPT